MPLFNNNNFFYKVHGLDPNKISARTNAKYGESAGLMTYLSRIYKSKLKTKIEHNLCRVKLENL